MATDNDSLTELALDLIDAAHVVETAFTAIGQMFAAMDLGIAFADTLTDVDAFKAEVRRGCAQVYASQLTAEEMRAGIAWHRSPAGRSAFVKQPALQAAAEDVYRVAVDAFTKPEFK